MNKIKLVEMESKLLKEAPEDNEEEFNQEVDQVASQEEVEDTGINQVPDMQDEPVTSLDDQSSDESPDFITSQELNEIREVLLDVPDDIMLLMLNDEVIVFGTEEDNVTKLFTLSDSQDNFGLIEMPMELSEIMNNDAIIKYTPENVDSRHQQIMDILMSKLDVEEGTDSDDSVEEVIDDEEQD